MVHLPHASRSCRPTGRLAPKEAHRPRPESHAIVEPNPKGSSCNEDVVPVRSVPPGSAPRATKSFGLASEPPCSWNQVLNEAGIMTETRIQGIPIPICWEQYKLCPEGSSSSSLRNHTLVHGQAGIQPAGGESRAVSLSSGGRGYGRAWTTRGRMKDRVAGVEARERDDPPGVPGPAHGASASTPPTQPPGEGQRRRGRPHRTIRVISPRGSSGARSWPTDRPA